MSGKAPVRYMGFYQSMKRKTCMFAFELENEYQPKLEYCLDNQFLNYLSTIQLNWCISGLFEFILPNDFF